jgi:TolB-like protein/Tfp pilus assembly protein PilF
MGFVAELKRRKVFKVGAAYLVVAWVLVQAASIGFPAFDAPPWALRVFILFALLGFPIALVMAWVFDVTPEGVRLDPNVNGNKRVFAVSALLVVLALGWYFYGQPSFRKGDVTTPVSYPPPAVAAPKNSIAVMAFDDLSPAHDQEYFSDGMSEEILNALGRVKGLKVIGRSSSFEYKGKNVGARQVGEALGVAHLLQGSVRRQGDKLRISVALVQTRDGAQVWTNSYDGSLADVFALQENCARDIAAQLKVALSGGDLVAKASDSPQAYALFVEAQTLVNRRFGDSLPRALVLLKQATTLDPNFARAWSKQALVYAVLAQYVGGDWTSNWKLSDEAARRALALDPNDAEAYAAISYNAFSQRRYVDMVAPMQRALALDPDNSSVAFWAANESSAMGRTSDAKAGLDRMLSRDPRNELLLFYQAFMLWRMHDVPGALDMIHRIGNDQYPFAQMLLAQHSASVGDNEAAVTQNASAYAFRGSFSHKQLEAIFRGVVQGGAYRAPGLKVLEANSVDDWTPTLMLELGESQRSFDLFEHGQSGLSDAYLNWLWQPEAWSVKARHDPAFQGFAKRMGMVDYWKKFGWPDLCKPAPTQGPDAFTCQ